MNEDNKVAVVTGASSGIGLATAVEFAQNGYDVVLAARREVELHDTALECEAYGVSTLVVQTDTADALAVDELAARAVEQFGRIDVWVNDAAVYLAGKLEDIPVSDMQQLMNTNFFGYVYGSRVALTCFKEQGFGTLINISSVNAAAPQPYISIYSASKAAVRALSESLRMELILEGAAKTIHVCTVMPASIDTNLYQNGANYTGHEIKALEPVYDPHEVARKVVQLASTPKREVIVGAAGQMMAMQNTMMPAMYERQIAYYTKKDMLSDEPEDVTRGNLYEPIPYNRGVYGGWRQRRVRADYLNVGVVAGVSLLVSIGLTGYGLWKMMHRRSSEI